ncbi:hypothetical protein LIER_28955 [Lithospermum erythrorhizon]|uniref:AIPP2-like SPOC-like domain-containing protein n=1 Tax=Lithospermum erythrorhizon TaxID=34254 RepID=A0AAV3RHI1_LITER
MVYLTGQLVGGDVHANVHLKSSEAEKHELKNLQPNVELKSSEAEKDKLKNVQPAVEQYRGPAQDASWKGSFKMLPDECNERLCSGIQGCPPSIVVKQVYEMSKKMPETLQFELLPRADVWKSIFQDRCPNFDDVGLFFFPSENKRCDDYFTWLEFIGKNDRVMRMCMWGVELLVFTSAHLHKNCQTWHGAHFFWGLFSVEKVRRSMMADNRDVLRLCPPNEIWNCCSKGDDSITVDMVIDMEAGMDVGMVDVVKKRKSREDCCGAVEEPFITTTTNVASARLALSMVKEEPCNDSPLVMEKMCKQIATGPLLQAKSPRIGSPSNIICSPQKNVSLQIDARAGALSSKEVHSDIPPGFKELHTLKTTVASNVPPGFEPIHT